MSEIVGFEKNINTSCGAVQALMNSDNYDVTKQTDVLTAIKVATNSTGYINEMRSKINLIKADGKFDANDIPTIFAIVLKSNQFLASIVSNGMVIKTSFQTNSVKYIVFGVLYFVMLSEKVDQILIDQLTQCFGPLWELVSFDPKKMFIKVKSCCCK